MYFRKLFALVSFAFFILACGNNEVRTGVDNRQDDSLLSEQTGDSTIYGLACDGCTDTVLVFLPLSNISADPDTFNILTATRLHRIFGRPQVGDRIAVVRSPNDSTAANFVIVMEDLHGKWCYQAYPSLKKRADQSDKTHKQIMEALPDSLLTILNTPMEYGMQLSGDNIVTPIGTFGKHTQKHKDEIDYPVVKHYRQWRLHNGKLLLTSMSMDSMGISRVSEIDTADFVMLNRDTLVLRFANELRGYYRKN